MERRRVKLSTCGIAILATVFTLASPLYGQKDTGLTATSQEDAANLQVAREYFRASRLDDAERICMSLVSKGGAVAADAQTLLDQVKSRRACEEDYSEALHLIPRGGCTQAKEFLQRIQHQCRDFPVDGLVRAAKEQCPEPPRLPGLDEGKTLLNGGKYAEALAFFARTESTYPNPAELQGLIQKAKEGLEAQREVEQLARNTEASLRQSDLGHAKEQLARLQKLAPQDGRIPMLQAKVQRLQADQEQDRTNVQDALLKDAIHEFYAGALARADQQLQKYLGESSNYKALAYFYRGAIACTEYFLSGAKDQQEQARAREFFSKARRADGGFTPSRDWISPKIIEIYEKTETGPGLAREKRNDRE